MKAIQIIPAKSHKQNCLEYFYHERVGINRKAKDAKWEMNNWFTVEEIDSATYAISEYKHWEETHCYLLCGTERAVLVDTGLGVANIREVVDGLTALPVTVITTHAHWDHIGGHKYFADFAVHENEVRWIAEQFPIPLQAVKKNLTLKPCAFPADFCLNDYRIFKSCPTSVLHDGDVLDLGNRTLQVIHTSGHSPGHCCFYEQDRGWLYTGDLIYKGCLDAFYPTTDPLAFMRSVEKIQNLNLTKILPAHHRLTISVSLVDEIANAFNALYQQGKLWQGDGVFDFGDFQIHI